MRILVSVATLGLWLVPGLYGRAQQDESRALLAKAIKAHGGEKALAALAALQQKGKGRVWIPNESPFTAELLSQAPDKNKIALDVDVKGKTYAYVQVLDGDKGWVKDFTGNTYAMDAPALTEAKQLM